MKPHFPLLNRPCLLATAITAASISGIAQADGNTDRQPFTLGVITVTANPLNDTSADRIASSLEKSVMQQFNRDTLGDALNLLPGITSSVNSRNENIISVRGFDPRQVPVFIDGIPVYVPYDGYIDFNRFTTADLASIQVAKGFSAMTYGPNTLGGAINLVSRKPLKALESDVSIGISAENGQRVQGNIGSNQGSWYVQAGASLLESDGFNLSKDFIPTATEDGGQRNNSYQKDSKLSLKLGLTPNETDEFAISYYQQNGEKGQPPSTIPASARYWQWPYWDKESLYLITRQKVSNNEFLNIRIYHDRYDNEVDSFTDGTYSIPKTSGPGSVSTGRSIYNDRTNGGSISLESYRIDKHSLRFTAHYKTDEHKEKDGNNQLNSHFEDSLVSFAAEDTIQLADRYALTVGASRHELRPDTVFSLGNAYSLPSAKSATDTQAELRFQMTESTSLYTSIANKSRLPTLKDRYSQRLGSYVENPQLQPESTLNYEIGAVSHITKESRVEAAIFRSDITDKIQEVKNVVGTKSQMQNIGEVRLQGAELSVTTNLTPWISLGGNYTLIDVDNLSNPATRVTDIPRHKVILNAIIRPIPTVELTTFAEHDSRRWSSNTVELGDVTTFNFKAAWTPIKALEVETGLNNLADRNNELSAGFPSAGRTWFANINYSF